MPLRMQPHHPFVVSKKAINLLRYTHINGGLMGQLQRAYLNTNPNMEVFLRFCKKHGVTSIREKKLLMIAIRKNKIDINNIKQ